MIKLEQPDLMIEDFLLRQLRDSDVDEMFIIKSNDSILEFLDSPKARNRNEALVFIHKIQSGVTHNDWYYWGITQPESESIIGTVCLWNLDEKSKKADVGFVLLPEFQGRGVMQCILPKILNFGFQELGLSTIEAEVAPQNVKSLSLLKNNGFTFACKEGETDIYALVSS
ncbi:GNAT family N-acetyltransferase [Vibrio sonorensis]|uniref:GNAT family N-acetyltransferase n=1 Tax=Vibrio sonorensis TaxID=1004316 RepID=UPI0008D9DCD0|nr:GNAT family N-acetyltransferase [Vibrio sonorensis]